MAEFVHPCFHSQLVEITRQARESGKRWLRTIGVLSLYLDVDNGRDISMSFRARQWKWTRDDLRAEWSGISEEVWRMVTRDRRYFGEQARRYVDAAGLAYDPEISTRGRLSLQSKETYRPSAEEIKAIPQTDGEPLPDLHDEPPDPPPKAPQKPPKAPQKNRPQDRQEAIPPKSSAKVPKSSPDILTSNSITQDSHLYSALLAAREAVGRGEEGVYSVLESVPVPLGTDENSKSGLIEDAWRICSPYGTLPGFLYQLHLQTIGATSKPTGGFRRVAPNTLDNAAHTALIRAGWPRDWLCAAFVLADSKGYPSDKVHRFLEVWFDRLITDNAPKGADIQLSKPDPNVRLQRTSRSDPRQAGAPERAGAISLQSESVKAERIARKYGDTLGVRLPEDDAGERPRGDGADGVDAEWSAGPDARRRIGADERRD